MNLSAYSDGLHGLSEAACVVKLVTTTSINDG